MCEVRDRAESAGLLIHCAESFTVVLSRYPRQWGHVLVILNRHVTRFVDVADAEWHSANAAALTVARRIETHLRPSRCFIASLGCERTDVPMTSPHLHLHVIPVGDSSQRPRDIFSWENGVYDGTAEEWRELHGVLATAWR